MDEKITVDFTIEPKIKMNGQIKVPTNLIEGQTVVRAWENVTNYILENLDDANMKATEDNYDFSRASVKINQLLQSL